MNFQVTGLKRSQFADLIGLSDAQLATRNVRRVVADRHPGFPCRVSLVDAQPGESLLLLNYEHLAAASPYRASHAIYVRENASDARLSVNEIPAVLRTRLLSVRGFSAQGMLLGAEVVEGTELVPIIDGLLSDDAVAFLHVHNARPGCYAARIDRA
jgi:hypothetical protein